MSCGIRTEGFPSWEELKNSRQVPSDERFQKGPVAIIECVEHIPCNPCEACCPFGAITIGEPITNLPRLDFDKCVGCGTCIAHCSGLAIFVVDKTFSADRAAVSFPHEYLPLPRKGQTVTAVGRDGENVCKAEVIRVTNPPANDHTPVVMVAVPVEFADVVRGMRRREDEPENAAAKRPAVCPVTDDDDVIVCRCEEVTKGEIRRAIAEGAATVSAVKRRTRAGMGLCQGRTCSKIISRMLKEANGGENPLPDTARFPLKPVEFGVFLKDDQD